MKDGQKKAAEWNPELSSRSRTDRAIGRPRKRWEDDINDFLKQTLEEKEKDEPIERKIQNNNIWINTAKWARLEKIHNEMCKMTRKRNSDVVLEKSSSSTAIKGIVMMKAAAEQRS